MLQPVPYTDRPDGPKALLTLIRLPGQRWRHLACFGRRGHYFADGSCEHTDAALSRLTEYGRHVTKLVPFGDGPPPKRPAKRTQQETSDAKG